MWRLVNKTTRARYNVEQKTEANGRKRTVRGRSGRTALSSAAAWTSVMTSEMSQ